MSDSFEQARPGRLWKGLSEDRRTAAATAFWADEQAGAEQAEMLGVIARQINFRPKSVVALPLERKVKLLVRSAQVPEAVAARLLVTYHLAHQRPMMKAFLDALGMPHDEGLLEDDVKTPAADRLASAGRQLLAQFGREDVDLYFRTLLLQDPETWNGLEALLQEAGDAHAQTE